MPLGRAAPPAVGGQPGREPDANGRQNGAFQRQYTPDGQGNASHADFKYYPLGGLEANPLCQAEYAGPKYEKLRQVAEDQFTKEKHLAITAADPKKWSLGVT